MAFSNGENSISLEDIKDKISDIELIAYYFNITKLPCVINSPFRSDSHPSFGFYSKDGEKIYWTDFGTKESGNVYDLLSKLWNCSYKEVLIRIQKDLLNFDKSGDIKKYIKKNVDISRVKLKSDLQCKIRDWQQYDIDYWNSYGISLEWLKYAEVYPISHKIILSGKNKYIFKTDKYAYVFVEHKEGNTTIKIYQPFNKQYKWANKHDKSVISLWTKIPEKGDKVVICSSLKDALCLWSNINIPSLAVQGEGYNISNTAISELKRRYKNIYILFDNDETGLIDSKKLAESTGFINIVLPQFKGGKDISDLYKIKGKEEFINIMFNLFKNLNYE